METHIAYCSVCDARIEVGFAPGREEAAPPVRLRCLDPYPGCGGAECPLPSETLAEPGPETSARLARHLEFVPLGGRTHWPATLADSASVVRRGRRASLERQFRRRPGPAG